MRRSTWRRGRSPLRRNSWNYLGQYATEIGNDYNLYASVMVAQASLETAYGTSKLSTVSNNLFGIKGSYAGNSIVMRTWEKRRLDYLDRCLLQALPFL